MLTRLSLCRFLWLNRSQPPPPPSEQRQLWVGSSRNSSRVFESLMSPGLALPNINNVLQMMSILCYASVNDRGSILKSVLGEWGPMFSLQNLSLARSAFSQWGPRPPVPPLRADWRAQPHQTPSTHHPARSANLPKEIKSTLLFHPTFICRATPPLGLWFDSSSPSRATCGLISDHILQSARRPRRLTAEQNHFSSVQKYMFQKLNFLNKK